MRKFDFAFSKLRGYVISGKGGGQIASHVSIPFPKNMIFKGSFNIRPYCRLESSAHHSITLGNNTTVCSFTTIETAGGDIDIGDNVIVGEYSTLQGQGGITIEDNVLMASHIHIISNAHDFIDPTVAIKYQRDIPMPVVIKENAWIGINVTILSGVTIGKNSVVGTGSVVKDDVPDYCVAVGTPAKVVRKYDFTSNAWVRVKN